MKKDLLLFSFSAVLLAACQGGGQPGAVPTASPATAAAPTPSYDPSWTDLNRVKANTLAPEFALEDQAGKTHKLSDYRGRKTVVLVFYRGYF
jgi:cytochrome oxidase Cu insertion factor (SCO1/SenC/PrrC family)